MFNNATHVTTLSRSDSGSLLFSMDESYDITAGAAYGYEFSEDADPYASAYDSDQEIYEEAFGAKSTSRVE